MRGLQMLEFVWVGFFLGTGTVVAVPLLSSLTFFQASFSRCWLGEEERSNYRPLHLQGAQG